jgi:hypothetical protein
MTTEKMKWMEDVAEVSESPMERGVLTLRTKIQKRSLSYLLSCIAIHSKSPYMFMTIVMSLVVFSMFFQSTHLTCNGLNCNGDGREIK